MCRQTRHLISGTELMLSTVIPSMMLFLISFVTSQIDEGRTSSSSRIHLFFVISLILCPFLFTKSMSMKDIRDSRDANGTTAQEVTSITDLQAMLGRFWEAHSRQFRGKKPHILAIPSLLLFFSISFGGLDFASCTLFVSRIFT